MFMGSRRAVLFKPSAFDPATIAWVNAVVTAGGTVSGTQKGFVDTAIKSLKSNSLFSVMDDIWLHAAENTQQARIGIVNLNTCTVHGTPTFTASQGYTGDGSAAYLDTGITGTNFTQNSGCLGTYVRTSRTSAQNYVEIGASDLGGAHLSYIQPLTTGPAFFFDVSGATFPSVSSANAQGFYVTSRTSSTSVAAYKNSSSSAIASSNADNSGNVGSFSTFLILALNSTGAGGTVANFTTDQIAISLIGAGLTGAQAAQLMTILNAYMTSLGTNVY